MFDEEKKKSAVILLHEIYGKNQFIEEECQKYANLGFDVFCPDLLGRRLFSYGEEVQAYDYFMQKVGFDTYREINGLAGRLEGRYDRLLLIGFSAAHGFMDPYSGNYCRCQQIKAEKSIRDFLI